MLVIVRGQSCRSWLLLPAFAICFCSVILLMHGYIQYIDVGNRGENAPPSPPPPHSSSSLRGINMFLFLILLLLLV